MHCRRYRSLFFLFALLCIATNASAAGRLGVFDAWIRAAPPGVDMVAGYATLKNTSDEPIVILTVQSDVYRMASLHQTVIQEGVSRMRELHRLKIAPGETLQLAPGGMHLMLMQPRHDVAVGEKVAVRFMLLDGTRVETYFDVVAADSSGG